MPQGRIDNGCYLHCNDLPHHPSTSTRTPPSSRFPDMTRGAPWGVGHAHAHRQRADDIGAAHARSLPRPAGGGAAAGGARARRRQRLRLPDCGKMLFVTQSASLLTNRRPRHAPSQSAAPQHSDGGSGSGYLTAVSMFSKTYTVTQQPHKNIALRSCPEWRLPPGGGGQYSNAV